MNPAIQPGVMKRMTALEYASLRDVGWGSDAVGVPVPPAAPTPTTASFVTPGPVGPGRFAVSTDAGPSGGAVSVYTGNGQLVSQTPGLSAGGGTRVATGDVDVDGVADTVYGAAPGDLPRVTVVSGSTGGTIASFLAYEEAFRGGVNVAVGHITHGSRADIVVGADAGGGPRVRVFAGGNPNAVVADFWGIADANFRGGVRLAVGDVNADGRDDLVAAAGVSGGPRVAVYDGRSVAAGSPQRVVWDFYAFTPAFVGGTYVAVGDLNGDGYGDVIAGAGEGGGPHVRAFSGRSLTRGVATDEVASFFAGDPNTRGGVRVAAADTDGDGRSELVTAPGPNTDGTVRVYAGSAFRPGIAPLPSLQINRPEWAVSGAFVG
jgi:hypothetical protein